MVVYQCPHAAAAMWPTGGALPSYRRDRREIPCLGRGRRPGASGAAAGHQRQHGAGGEGDGGAEAQED